MKTLIIFSHPDRISLNGQMLASVLTGTDRAGDETRVVDLYKENFNPVLVFNETKRRRDMHRDPEIGQYQRDILWAERIVFVYPIFWGRPPAMLLGFIDRLFASNFAYRDVGRIYPEGLLKGREVVCISTMKGPTHYIRLTLANAHQVLMRKALFNFTGIKRVKFFEFGSMESNNFKRQEKALRRVERFFSK
jgi:NAD(P)H dehydrogenase (quinone)